MKQSRQVGRPIKACASSLVFGHPANDALQQLTGVRARVVGGVLNDPDATLAQYGGYERYTYAYAG